MVVVVVVDVAQIAEEVLVEAVGVAQAQMAPVVPLLRRVLQMQSVTALVARLHIHKSSVHGILHKQKQRTRLLRIGSNL